MRSLFKGATNMNGDISCWKVDELAGDALKDTFKDTTSLTSCKKHKIALAWVDNLVFQASSYDTGWTSEKCPPQTDAEFKLASWEWVQDAATAACKWGDIGGWDVSGVKDFNNAFSKHRDVSNTAVTGTDGRGGNPKVTTFITGLADISKWITTSVTSLYATFHEAGEMNVDVGAWTVEKVTNLQGTFMDASKFVGTGLGSWITSSVTTLRGTFYGATEMNCDMSSWNVAKVTTLQNTFSSVSTVKFTRGPSKFVGTGLNLWITSSIANLEGTFRSAGEMNVDLSGWSLGKVTNLRNTFMDASKFVGTGLSKWDTSSVTVLKNTFHNADSMNENLGGWSVVKGE